MLKEVIVAEGKQDVVAIKRALDAEVIITGGFTLNKSTLEKIRIAYEQRGIIILTDPDKAGENIRKYLSDRFPQAKHAFISRAAATANNDIGVEQAAPEVIRAALSQLHTQIQQPGSEFGLTDLLTYGLVGEGESSRLRDMVGNLLGIGYTNAKQFIYRLNNYGISRAAFEQAAESVVKR